MAGYSYDPKKGYVTFTMGTSYGQAPQRGAQPGYSYNANAGMMQFTPPQTPAWANTGASGTGYIYDPKQGRVVFNGPSGHVPPQYTTRGAVQSGTQANAQVAAQAGGPPKGSHATPGLVQRFFDSINGVHSAPAVKNINWNPSNGLSQMYYDTPEMMNSWWGRTQYNNQADQLHNGKVYNYEGREINNVPQMVVDNFLRTVNKMNGV